jgi:hypothetical protein
MMSPLYRTEGMAYDTIWCDQEMVFETVDALPAIE